MNNAHITKQHLDRVLAQRQYDRQSGFLGVDKSTQTEEWYIISIDHKGRIVKKVDRTIANNSLAPAVLSSSQPFYEKHSAIRSLSSQQGRFLYSSTPVKTSALPRPPLLQGFPIITASSDHTSSLPAPPPLKRAPITASSGLTSSSLARPPLERASITASSGQTSSSLARPPLERASITASSGQTLSLSSAPAQCISTSKPAPLVYGKDKPLYTINHENDKVLIKIDLQKIHKKSTCYQLKIDKDMKAFDFEQNMGQKKQVLDGRQSPSRSSVGQNRVGVTTKGIDKESTITQVSIQEVFYHSIIPICEKKTVAKYQSQAGTSSSFGILGNKKTEMKMPACSSNMEAVLVKPCGLRSTTSQPPSTSVSYTINSDSLANQFFQEKCLRGNSKPFSFNKEVKSVINELEGSKEAEVGKGIEFEDIIFVATISDEEGTSNKPEVTDNVNVASTSKNNSLSNEQDIITLSDDCVEDENGSCSVKPLDGASPAKKARIESCKGTSNFDVNRILSDSGPEEMIETDLEESAEFTPKEEQCMAAPDVIFISTEMGGECNDAISTHIRNLKTHINKRCEILGIRKQGQLMHSEIISKAARIINCDNTCLRILPKKKKKAPNLNHAQLMNREKVQKKKKNNEMSVAYEFLKNSVVTYQGKMGVREDSNKTNLEVLQAAIVIIESQNSTMT